jgi:hypothetical protein
VLGLWAGDAGRTAAHHHAGLSPLPDEVRRARKLTRTTYQVPEMRARLPVVMDRARRRLLVGSGHRRRGPGTGRTRGVHQRGPILPAPGCGGGRVRPSPACSLGRGEKRVRRRRDPHQPGARLLHHDRPPAADGPRRLCRANADGRRPPQPGTRTPGRAASTAVHRRRRY